MTQQTNNTINLFIKKEFPIKKVRNERNKWVRAIIIPQGYVRQDKKIYLINKQTYLSYDDIMSDISETVSYTFGFNQKEIYPIVKNYIKMIKI